MRASSQASLEAVAGRVRARARRAGRASARRRSASSCSRVVDAARLARLALRRGTHRPLPDGGRQGRARRGRAAAARRDEPWSSTLVSGLRASSAGRRRRPRRRARAARGRRPCSPPPAGRRAGSSVEDELFRFERIARRRARSCAARSTDRAATPAAGAALVDAPARRQGRTDDAAARSSAARDTPRGRTMTRTLRVARPAGRRAARACWWRRSPRRCRSTAAQIGRD